MFAYMFLISLSTRYYLLFKADLGEGVAVFILKLDFSGM